MAASASGLAIRASKSASIAASGFKTASYAKGYQGGTTGRGQYEYDSENMFINMNLKTRHISTRWEPRYTGAGYRLHLGG